MDSNQQLLVNLLSAAIRGQKYKKNIEKGVNWQAVFEESKAHQIHTLIYPIVKNRDTHPEPNNKLMSEWQKTTLFAGIEQIQHMQKMKDVLSAFNQSNIPVIALKGLVLRELYPQPELRTMGDADILVHKDHMSDAKNLLLQIGYYESRADSKHIHFSHPTHLAVELHQRLTNPKFIQHTQSFEADIWKNAVPVDICNVPVLKLAPEDQILYLCLHMASHFLRSGFGLRQLCDLVLLVESLESAIDWRVFYQRSEIYGIQRFTAILFTLCKQMFDMKAPYPLDTLPEDETSYGNPLIDEIADDIISSGVFGNKTFARVFGNSLLQYADYKDCSHFSGKVKYYMSLLFPAPKRLAHRYAYAVKYPFLTPVAWMHRIIHHMSRKEFMLYVKATLFSSKKTVSVLKKRAKLLHRSGLQ